MKKYQKLRAAALSALFSLAMAVSAFAATGKISFSDPSVKEGEEVNVTMKIAADDGVQLSDATVTLAYDAAKLEFVAGTNASGGAGTIAVRGASNGAGTSELQYNLKFRTLAAGQSTVSINTQEVYDGAQQPVEMTHLGSASVTVTAGADVSADASLGELSVAPGELTPAFSPDVTDYEVSVDTSVSQLSVSAIPADSGASVVLSGNDALSDGDTPVVVRVTAADGQTAKEYRITVHRTEGAAAAAPGSEEASSEGESSAGGTETESSGVQLSSKGKTITIMNPGSDVQIPEGFKSSMITVDGQQVQGWVWGAEPDPQYCVIYGMNDQGELNFYRYDMAEKTIQRYFEDPLAAGSVSSQEYTALAKQYEDMRQSYDMRFLVICILVLVGLILLAMVIYLFAKLRSAQRAEERPQKRSRSWEESDESRADAYSVYDEELLRHDYEESPAESQPAIDETQVLRRPSARRRVSGDTMPIPDAEGASKKADAGAGSGKGTSENPVFGAAGAEKAGDPETDGASEKGQKETDEDEFDTFRI